MYSVLVCNQKGGVGKSLISDETAFAMERCGDPVSFCDLDELGGTIHETNNIPGAVAQIIDTPGALQRDIKDWMESADIIVIPFRPSSRDIPPLLRMMRIAETHARGKPVLYVMNGWNRYRVSKQFDDWLQEQMKDKKDFHMLVNPQSEQFVQASALGISVVEYAPRSNAAASIKQVTNWVRSQLGLKPEPIMSAKGG